jgi:hypothetical protein
MALKIGIISHAKHTICEPFAGGLEAHTAYLAQALIRNGHAVTVPGMEPPPTMWNFFAGKLWILRRWEMVALNMSIMHITT